MQLLPRLEFRLRLKLALKLMYRRTLIDMEFVICAQLP